MNIVHQQFGEVWVEKKQDGSIWFSGKEVCDMLGYKNDTDALKRHVPEKHSAIAKRYLRSENGVNQQREITIINESGFYRLILRSRMQYAEEIMDWVTEEVLPSLRKTGSYEVPRSVKNLESKEIKKMLKEIRTHLTITDERNIERKLGIRAGLVSSVLAGYRQDVTILEECMARAKRNKGLRKALYTYEGASKIIEILQSEMVLKLVIQ